MSRYEIIKDKEQSQAYMDQQDRNENAQIERKGNQMKFEEYVSSCKKKDLHPEITSIYSTISNTFDFQNNIILYGPSGIGKYTQALKFIKPLSISGLKYERNMNINLQKKKQYTFKISDIHFEIDMELLGCNPRVLWN